MKINGLSASSYKTYSWCEWKWTLLNIFRISEDTGPAGIVGHIAHKCFEILAKCAQKDFPQDHKCFDVEYLWKLSFNHFYKKTPKESCKIPNDKLKKISLGVKELVNSDMSPIRDNIIGVEQYFKIPIKDPRFVIDENAKTDELKYFSIRGFIDRIDELDKDTIEIIDYKTGQRSEFHSDSKEKKDSISLRDDIQPRLYHLAASLLYPQYKNIIVTFIYLVDGGPITSIFSECDLPDTYRTIYDRFLDIRDNENPTRNKTWKCRFCHFNPDKTGVCDLMWEEKNQTGLEFLINKHKMLQ